LRSHALRLALLGTVLFVAGQFLYLAGVAVLLFSRALPSSVAVASLGTTWCWVSGLPTAAGVVLIAIDLFLLLPGKRRHGRRIENCPPRPTAVAVALTSYNDEDSIGLAVRDFLGHPLVSKVIVVDNNSRDRSAAVAAEAGAVVVTEPQPGYGRCVHRCLQVLLAEGDTDYVVLCEGDMTFRARDLEKLTSYAPHADIVNGTRVVEQLRALDTQLSTFMYYGNFFVGKLLEIKHFGRGTFTDVGTTYKLLRRDILPGLLPALDPGINLEFNAYFMDRALALGYLLLECPITFHQRKGVSKGGNTSNWRALKVGLRMIVGLLTNWRWRA
jgi:glycosyltransferase involved in cell wall biosynthesis